MPVQGSLSIERVCRLTGSVELVSIVACKNECRWKMLVEDAMEVRSAIPQIAVEHRHRYGYRRIAAERRRRVNHKRVARIMREDNLLGVAACLRGHHGFSTPAGGLPESG
jgi:HTH-like domain